MSNYDYSSYSSSGSGAAAGGTDATSGLFSQVDANRDGSIDRNEFSNWVGNASGGAGQVGFGAGGAGSGFESSSYGLSNFSSGGGGGAGAGAGGAYGLDAGFGGFAGGAGGAGGASSYESSSFSSGGNVDAGAFGGNNFQASSFESSSAGGAGFDSSAVSQAAGYTSDSNAAWLRYGAEVRGNGLYVDSNPQIIRRQAPGGVQTYTQNIKVRFLQPPPVPPPGVSDGLA